MSSRAGGQRLTRYYQEKCDCEKQAMDIFQCSSKQNDEWALHSVLLDRNNKDQLQWDVNKENPLKVAFPSLGLTI